MLAVAGMLFVSSCAQDDALEGAADSNYVDATFTVTTENAVGTRAGATNVGEGTTVNYVACAIFDEKTGEEIEGLRQYKAITNKAATYSVRLVKGQGYRAVFFAYCGQDNGVNAYYDLSDLKEVEVLPANSNLEERDAFTGYVDVKAEETLNSVTKPVKLTRPFAQLNLGSYDEDIEAAATAEVVVTESKVTVSNVYTVFSAYDNAVPATATSTQVTFAMNEIPAQTLSVDKDNDATTPDEQYEYLALNYLLVGNTGAEKNLTDVSFEWKTADGKTNSPATTFINIPVQRNYRTNIVGYLLTNPADFNVTIEKEFAKPDYNVAPPVSVLVTVPENNTEDVVLSTETIAVTVPASAASEGDNFKIVVSNESAETNNTTGETTVAFDLTMYKNNVKVSGETVYEVVLNVGAGKIISNVMHNGTPLTNATTGADQTYTYDSATGELTVYTKSFSPFAITYADYKDYVRTKNFFYGGYISVSTGSDLLPIVAIMPEITKFCVFDGDTRITDAVTFRFSDVKKETISENSYKVSLNLAIKDDKGNNLELKPGMPSTINGKEYLHVYMNLIEVPAGYAISEVKVGGTSLTAITSGNVATGEYWIGSDAKDLYFQSKTAGLIEVTLTK